MPVTSTVVPTGQQNLGNSSIKALADSRLCQIDNLNILVDNLTIWSCHVGCYLGYLVVRHWQRYRATEN